MKRKIVLITAGDIPAPVIKRLKSGLPEVFGLSVKLLSRKRPPRRAFNEMRGQYDAIKIIESMLKNMPQRAEKAHSVKALMVVNEDLFIPVLTHVFGEAQLGGTAGVVSLYRLKGSVPGGGAPQSSHDPLEILSERALKEAVHELGHTFGMTHCRDFTCPMSVSGDAWSVDRKAASLCGPCGFLLRKTHSVKLNEPDTGTERGKPRSGAAQRDRPKIERRVMSDGSAGAHSGG